MNFFAKCLFVSAAASLGSVALAQIPSTGIGPAPVGVTPGGVVPVPSTGTTGTYVAPSVSPGAIQPAVPNMTPPGPLAPPPSVGAPGTLAPPSAPIGVAATPTIPGGITPTINTFSEQQVRSSLLAQGYSNISGLTMDGSGTWRGTATLNGANVPVGMTSNGQILPH